MKAVAKMISPVVRENTPSIFYDECVSHELASDLKLNLKNSEVLTNIPDSPID